jgi:hypothetical protein
MVRVENRFNNGGSRLNHAGKYYLMLVEIYSMVIFRVVGIHIY